MRFPNFLRLFLVAASFLAASTGLRAQCDTWRNLPALTATGYAGNPTSYVNDKVGHTLYVVEQCYCGYHGINLPTVYQWSGTSWWPLTNFEEGTAYGMAMFDDGTGNKLHIWGTMQSWPSVPSFQRLNGQQWEPATSLSPPNPYAIVRFDDGTGETFYAATPNGVLRWSGTSWVSIGATPANYPATALVVHDDGSGPAIFAGGGFTSIGGTTAAGIARWNGTAWSALGTGLESVGPVLTSVNFLRSFQDGATRSLYVGGHFVLAGGNAANGVARWDGATWTGLGVDIAAVGSVLSIVTGMERFDDGTGHGARLYVGGMIQPYVAFLARLDESGWTAVPGSFGSSYWGPLLGTFDFPETPGLDLLSSSGAPPYNLHPVALEACALTGTISCVGDGSGAACPCGNESTPAERAGCNSSLGHGGALRASGHSSLTSDTLRLEGSAMPNSAVLYFQGASTVAQHVFGDGLKCVGGPFVRVSTKTNASGASIYPTTGDAPVSVKGQVHAPGLRHYQARYRNSALFCTSDTFNYTNAVDILWEP